MNITAVITAAAAAAVTALAPASCGSSPAATAGPPTISQAAKQAGCTRVADVSHAEVFAHQSATCDLPGYPASDLATFASTSEQRSWEKVARQFGVIVKHGTLWSVAGS